MGKLAEFMQRRRTKKFTKAYMASMEQQAKDREEASKQKYIDARNNGKPRQGKLIDSEHISYHGIFGLPIREVAGTRSVELSTGHRVLN